MANLENASGCGISQFRPLPLPSSQTVVLKSYMSQTLEENIFQLHPRSDPERADYSYSETQPGHQSLNSHHIGEADS